jgi:hypothetical protein
MRVRLGPDTADDASLERPLWGYRATACTAGAGRQIMLIAIA